MVTVDRLLLICLALLGLGLLAEVILTALRALAPMMVLLLLALTALRLVAGSYRRRWFD